MYDARKIANWILDEFDARQWDISNLKLNKCLYFVQGWGYARLQRKIIRNHFVAWEYGPVVRPIWDSFKKFGSNPVTSPALYMNYQTGKIEPVAFDDIDLDCRNLCKTILPHYLSMTSSELVNLTHRPGTPWALVRHLSGSEQTLFQRIPEELIVDYFKSEFGREGRH